ncbi:MAG: hypothetical protein HYS44_00875 [Candidatus Niyogibacteria bacterium]|nr:hypothetical protein [Candidatus Niyogibacteria bacterium]
MTTIQEVAVQEWGASIIRFAEKIAALCRERMESKELGTNADEWVQWHFLFRRAHLSIWVHVRVFEHQARIYVIPEGLRAAARLYRRHVGDVRSPDDLEDLIPAVLARFPHPPCKVA